MKKMFLTVVVTILCSSVYISCTPEVLTSEEETEILTVDPSNDGQIEDEDEEETGDE
ncbi:hypothetical protein [Kordia jejudonensis]|uniref:hypothetical protein n=1 Tax=Kordia jejudonensis TaxID=1348245 RepID=UPI0012E06D77|nr:hypothetical protein [Kordia jejudonensis]